MRWLMSPEVISYWISDGSELVRLLNQQVINER